MRADGPTTPAGWREYARLEYNEDGAALYAAYRDEVQTRHLRTNGGPVRTVLRALAKVPQALVALATPGGG